MFDFLSNLKHFKKFDKKKVVDVNGILEENTFKQQYDFITSTSRFKLALCSRRAGKSTGVAHGLIYYATSGKNFHCVYLTKTRETAKRIIWDLLKELIKTYDLRAKVNEAELTILFPEFGSYILIRSLGDTSEYDKIRGLKYKLAVIDEAQMFMVKMDYLINDILAPALLDLGGQLWLTGTPPPSCAGFFVDSYRSGTWENHAWTMRENSFFVKSALENSLTCKTVEDVIQEELTRRNISITHPSIRREMFGELVRSDDMLVYKYDEKRNDYDKLPETKLTYVIGIDLGFSDSDAISCIGFSRNEKDLYHVEEFKKNKLTIDELAAKIHYFKEKYKPIAMVIDEGGLGKKVNETLSSRYNFAIEPAEKTMKFAYIEFLNSDMLLGHIKIKKDSELVQEMIHLTFNEDKFLEGKKVEDPYFDNHLCDSFLYAYKYCYHYRAKPDIKTPLSLEEIDEQKAINSYKKRHEKYARLY